MRLADFSIGDDARNRVLLSPFASRTGRNQPSNSKFIPGAASWFRTFIRPRAGFALGYVDYEQEEFGIAAKLSGDLAMQEAYCSGDPYLTFGKQAGKIPPYGTRETHGAVRDQFKTLTLAVQYGMGADSLAQRLGQTVSDARELLRLHRQTYKKYWSWSDAVVDYAVLHGFLPTVFGWTTHLDPRGKLDSHLVRFLRNYPMQANGAEILRLACCLATERGIAVCCPVHDALLVEARLESLDDVVERTRAAMVEASEIVLSGFPLRVEAKLIRHPERFEDPRGAKMWSTIWSCMATISSAAGSNVAMVPNFAVPAATTSTATVMA
jgi:DNA polymerase I-like protein with 3'-5' exonuclease and polymerase domains